MAATPRSVVFPEGDVRKPECNPLRVSELASLGKKKDDAREQELCRRLFERFMASCGPYEVPKETDPCVLYTMWVSVKQVRAFWSHRSSSHFFPERQGSTFPIAVCRAAGLDDQVEPMVDRSCEPHRPGVVSGIFDDRYHLIELSREKGVMYKEGSPVPWREVALIQGMPGGRGITVTSHVDDLVVRLHDIFFRLSGPSASVDLRFSEYWFHLPAGWTEERLYAEDGYHIVDIASPVEKLMKKLCQLRKDEEAVAAAKPSLCIPPVWDTALWLIDEAHPEAARCYSKFELSMNSDKKVSCKCVEQESLQSILRRVDNCENVLPISEPAPGSASSSALEILGFVESYDDLESSVSLPNSYGMDRSGCELSSVLMLSRGEAKLLTVELLVQRLDILLDDGLVMSGCYGSSVDIHCDDLSSSELLKRNWIYHVSCKNTDGECRISFSVLLAHLKKKLQLQLTEEESVLYSTSRLDAEDNEDLAEIRRKQLERVPPKPKPKPKPKPDLPEIELHHYSMLFPAPWESEFV